MYEGLEKQATKFIGRTTDQDVVRLKMTLDVLGDKHGGWEAWRMVVPRTPQRCPQIHIQMRPEHTGTRPVRIQISEIVMPCMVTALQCRISQGLFVAPERSRCNVCERASTSQAPSGTQSQNGQPRKDIGHHDPTQLFGQYW
jgi:hypothetical protein